eukprot:11700995-Alexandrium_andersonii.AAC.1
MAKLRGDGRGFVVHQLLHNRPMRKGFQRSCFPPRSLPVGRFFLKPACKVDCGLPGRVRQRQHSPERVLPHVPETLPRPAAKLGRIVLFAIVANET